MKLLIIEPVFSPLGPAEIEILMPNFLRAFGHPPDSLIIDETGSNMGTYLRGWCDKFGVPYETMKLFPYLNNTKDSVVQHIEAVDKASGVIMFYKQENVLTKVVVEQCKQKSIPLITYYCNTQ